MTHAETRPGDCAAEDFCDVDTTMHSGRGGGVLVEADGDSAAFILTQEQGNGDSEQGSCPIR